MAYNKKLPAPTFDLDTWANNYEGALLPFRLHHLATHCPPLARPSLALAIAAAKRGKDVQLYTRLHDTANRLGLAGLDRPDPEWAVRQEEANRRELARLEGELRGYKNNLIRESIRMGQADLAMHLLRTGGPPPDPTNPQSLSASGYNAAYAAFGKMRDYCTTPTHVASMTLRLLHTALLQAVAAQQAAASPVMHFNTALANANRLRTVGVKEEEQARLTPIMHAAIGLAHLGLAAYRDAALALLAVPFEYATLGPVHGIDFPRAVASANDLAVAGGLCALATMTRDELLERVLAGPFRQFLELEPHMRKAISLYTTAKYQPCLAVLRRYYADWSLDLFLGAAGTSPAARDASHVDRLLLRIREKSITAYCASFSQVSLSALAATFPPPNADDNEDDDPRAALEEEVLAMIETGMLDARLDVVNGLLIAPRSQTRRTAHADAAAAAADVERALRLRLHRVNVALAGLEIPKPKTPAGWVGTGPGPGVAVGSGGGGAEGMRVGNGGYPS